MSLRNMDLRPATMRRRVRESCERSFVSRCAGVAGCLLVVAWSVGAFRLSSARRIHADVFARAEATMAIESELAATMKEMDRLGDDLDDWRTVSIPFRSSELLAAIITDLPESAGLERLELDAGSLVAAPLRAPRRDEHRDTPRRIEGEIEGFAASDEAVAAFVDALRVRPFFADVRVESTRHLDLEGNPARSFRLAFLIDLEVASPTLAPIEIGEGDRP
jgi:hypothetical protein